MFATETLTDEQCRALYDSTKDRSLRRDCVDAIRTSTAHPEVRRMARWRVVEHLNLAAGAT
jgi:hypothetical protein